MKTLLMAAALAFAPAMASAQDQTTTTPPASPATHTSTAPLADADPALWVVRDEDTTIYLFGTFHMLDTRPWFNDEVRTAFDVSDELVLEAILPENLAEIQPMILRYAVDPQGRKLSDRLTPEQNATLGRAFGTLGAPAAAFDRFEPWFVAMTLNAVATQQLGIDAANGPETVLMRAARERHLPIAELEGLEWQIRLFDGMPDEQQIAQLREALNDLDAMSRMLAPMLAAWSTGDVDGLQRIVDSQGDEDANLHRLLYTNRNATWAGWIQERLARPGIVFLAVGAGHLAGSDSVQAVLRSHGVNAQRVPHAETPAS